MWNKDKKKKLDEFEGLDMEGQRNELKKVIRLTYKVFLWISIFLLVPTIGHYFIDWAIVPIARDIGIFIVTFILWRINKRMDKKKKEEKQEEDN